MFPSSGIPIVNGKGRLPRIRRSLLILLASVLLAACDTGNSSHIRLGLASAPVTLDPRYATDATSSRVNRLLYASLVDFDDRQRPVAALADWQRLSPTHYRFHLKQDSAQRRFHNGSHLTASDVKATYDSVLDPAQGSPHRATLSLIDRIEVVNDDQLDFFLNKADLLFPSYLVIGILPSELLAQGHPFRTRPVGSGAFRFAAWPEEGHLELQRIRDGRYIDIIRVADATVRTLKLLRGELDIIQNDLPPELVAFLAARRDIQVNRTAGSNFTYLGFNLEDAATGDHRVREAIAHAIDRQAIIRYVMGRAAHPASALLPPGHWAGNPDLPMLEYNPALARSLLAEAGFDQAHPLVLNYKTSTNAFRVRLATVIQSQLNDVGIKLDINSYDWGTFYGDIKAGNFQMYSLSWVGIKSPDIFRYVFYSDSVPPKGANRGRFKDRSVDYLIDTAGRAPDLDTQATLYRQLQARLLAELPYVPLWYEDHVFAVRQGVTAYSLDQDGDLDGLATVTKP